MREAIYSCLMANGYGLYIWPCYLLFLIGIVGQLTVAIKKNAIVRESLIQQLQAGLISDQQT